MTSHFVWPREAHKASRLVTSGAGFYASPYISNKLRASTPETSNSLCTLDGTVWVFTLVAGVIKKYFVVILSGIILVIPIFFCSLSRSIISAHSNNFTIFIFLPIAAVLDALLTISLTQQILAWLVSLPISVVTVG